MDILSTPILIRKALAEEGPLIRAFVLKERMRPIDLKPENFLVAEKNAEIIGTIQLRHHADGTRELGSLVVAPEWRRRGIGGLLIDALLKRETQDIYMITARAHWMRYARWGFELVPGRSAPRSIRRHHLLGSLGSVVSLLKRRPMRRIVILKRAAVL